MKRRWMITDYQKGISVLSLQNEVGFMALIMRVMRCIYLCRYFPTFLFLFLLTIFLYRSIIYLCDYFAVLTLKDIK